jgi:hypothetical protein
MPNFEDLPVWVVVAAFLVYWIFIIVRATLWVAVPWYFKGVSVMAYPVAISALIFPAYETVLLPAGLVLIVVGFIIDGLWRRTEILGSFDDPRRKSRAGRHRRMMSADESDQLPDRPAD